MPERSFNPEQFRPAEPEPLPEQTPETTVPISEPNKEEKHVGPSFARKARRVALGAMLAVGSLGSEARANIAPEDAHDNTTVSVLEQQGKAKKRKAKSIQGSTNKKRQKPAVRTRQGGRPRELNASIDKGLDKEEAAANKFKIPFLNDTNVVKRLIREGQLRRVPEQGKGFFIDSQIGKGNGRDKRYVYPSLELLKQVAPYTLNFITTLGADFDRAFPGQRLKLTSLDRTLDRHRQIASTEPNAAKNGRSTHIRAGSTFDFSRIGLSASETVWIRKYLVNLEKEGKIHATEESKAFHVMVLPSQQFRGFMVEKKGQVSPRVVLQPEQSRVSERQVAERPVSPEIRPRGYPTRSLEGRHLGGLYTTYTGIKGRVPKYINIDFERQLTLAWNAKINRKDSNPRVAALQTVKKDLLARYDEKTARHVTLEEYQKTIQGIIKEMRGSIDWVMLGREKSLTPKQLALLQAVVGNLDCKDLVAYSLTEFMPSRIGSLNVEVFDFMLRNAGEEYTHSLPAMYDGLISFGPYQMTDIAMHDRASNRGALVTARAIRNHGIPQAVKDIRGNTHHRVAFALAIDNLANLMGRLDDKKELEIFARNWRQQRDGLVQYIAVAHTATSAGLGIGEKWVQGGMVAPLEKYTYGRYTDYALKTKNNLPALRERQSKKN